MKIPYKITRYFDYITPTEVGIYEINIDNNITFCELIDIIKNNHINDKGFYQIYIENLVEKTWGSIFKEELIDEMGIDSYHYKWLNHSIEEINKMFNLFKEPINIIIDGPGIGKLMGEEEGIRFIIHSDEKDKHANNPHVHCEYSGETIFVYLKTLEILNNKGVKNKKKTKIALKWIDYHKEELLSYWNQVVSSNANIDFKVDI